MPRDVSPTTRGPAHGITDRMVGRQRELDALASWLDAVQDGVRRLVLCAGEPGIGTKLGFTT